MANIAKPDNRELVSAALKLLAGRDMSRADFTSKLRSREFSPGDVEAVADWCQAEGWLNEARYAEGASRRLGAKYGAKRVAQTLRQKGVDDEAISASMAALKESEVDRARILWSRKFGAAPSSADERAKQIRYLQSRGFGFDTIKKVINGADDE
jgi:regulatory protein